MNKLCKVMVCILFLLTGLSYDSTAKETYTFAVVPQASAVDIHSNWTPFLEALSAELNVTFQLKVYPSIPKFEDALSKKEPDFAYMNPYHAIVAKKYQYTPFVRDQKDLVGIIVVAKDGPIKSTKDLDGKVIVFPSPNAFAASLYMRALLTEKEKINFTPKYVKTHQNVYRSVAASVAPAGGGVKSTLDDEETALQEKLTILYRTPGTPSHPICAQARISSQLMKSVEKAILKIGADPKNKQMMAKINIQSPVVADFNKDYAPLLHLGLEKYAETVKE